jgi:hypothetical protein
VVLLPLEDTSEGRVKEVFEGHHCAISNSMSRVSGVTGVTGKFESRWLTVSEFQVC